MCKLEFQAWTWLSGVCVLCTRTTMKHLLFFSLFLVFLENPGILFFKKLVTFYKALFAFLLPTMKSCLTFQRNHSLTFYKMNQGTEYSSNFRSITF